MSDLTRIFDRIAAGMFTPTDVHTIREHSDVRGSGNVVRIGRTKIDVRESGAITLENRTYRGHEAEAIREVLGQVCGNCIDRRGRGADGEGSGTRWFSQLSLRPTGATSSYSSPRSG